MINEREQRRHSCVLVDIVTKRHWKIYIRNLKQSSKITQFVHVCSILHVQIPIKKAQYHWPDHCLYPNIQCMSTMLTLVPSVPLSQSFQKTNEIVSVFFWEGGGVSCFWIYFFWFRYGYDFLWKLPCKSVLNRCFQILKCSMGVMSVVSSSITYQPLYIFPFT